MGDGGSGLARRESWHPESATSPSHPPSVPGVLMRKLVKLGLLPVLAGVLAIAVPAVASAATPTPFFNGFETNTDGWLGDITRVASGTHGIPSATGNFHAEAGPVDDGP